MVHEILHSFSNASKTKALVVVKVDIEWAYDGLYIHSLGNYAFLLKCSKNQSPKVGILNGDMTVGSLVLSTQCLTLLCIPL